jgi:hypothetical protein
MLRRKFGGSGKLHNEKLHEIYSPPNMIQVIKSRRMGWARHDACMGENRNMCSILV